MYHKITKSNGLKIILNPITNSQSITVLILVKAGSRFENKKNNGISHFLEHMFFKGGKRYIIPKDVALAVDSIGGLMNAFTGKEYAGYYIKIASKHIEKAIDVLSDMLLNTKFNPIEIEKERGVILQEYNMYQDTPMYQVLWDFERLIYGDQPLGWDQIGTKDNILKIQQKDFIEYKKKLYNANNTVIAVSGNLKIHKATELIEKYFKFPETTNKINFSSLEKLDEQENINIVDKKTEQIHFAMGFEGCNYQDKKEEMAMQMLATVLGGNMSSRLFQKIREDKGACYYVQTKSESYFDTGIFFTRCGINKSNLYDVLKDIKKAYKDIYNKGITNEEFKNSKEYIKGKIALSLEDSEEVSHFLASQELLTNDISTAEDLFKMIDEIDMEYINKIIKKYFDKKLFISCIGPDIKKEKLKDII